MVEDDAVGLLCDLIAASCRRFDPSALPPNCHGALAFLKRIGAVQNGELPSVVTCEACDDNHSARLEYDPAMQGYWHFCPEAGRVDVAHENLATLRVDREWLARWFVKILPIVPDRHKALVPESVWHLGDAVVDRIEVTVVFAVRVSTVGDLHTLVDAMRGVHPADLGLVITASAAPIPTLALPNQFHVLDLREIARIESDQLVVDKARLAGWIKAYKRGRNKPVQNRRGRSSEKHLVLEIARELRNRQPVPSTKKAKAEAILEEFIRRHPGVKPPAVSTITDRHLPEIES